MEQPDNVVLRLKRRLQQAKRLGFTVRMEVLQDQQPGWCQVGSTRLLFIDLAQPAALQLAQIEEILENFAAPASALEVGPHAQSVRPRQRGDSVTGAA